MQRFRILFHARGDYMVRNEIPQVIEPEKRELRKDFSLIGNLRRQDVIEGGNTIGGKEEEIVSGLIDVSNFAPGVQLQRG